MQSACQYMVFSTFEETVLLHFHLKVRTLISTQIRLFYSRNKIFEGWELCRVDLQVTQASPLLRILLCCMNLIPISLLEDDAPVLYSPD